MMPGQESIDFAVRPACGDALKCLGEPSGWIDVVHLRGLQECGDRRPCLPAAIRSDLMMPGVWGGKWWSIIPFTRCLGARQSWSPTNSTTASGI